MSLRLGRRKTFELAMGFGCSCGLISHANGQTTRSRDLSCVTGPLRDSSLKPIVMPKANGPVEVTTTGSPRLDASMRAAIFDCYDRFELEPAFFYIASGEDERNAFADKRSDGPYKNLPGVVGFGLPFLHEKLAADPRGFVVMYIVAHEFGHIMQYNLRSSTGRVLIDLLFLRDKKKLVELHADYVAGAYMADRYLRDPTHDISILNGAVANLGDNDVTSPDHHGTAAERQEAFREGYAARVAYGTVTRTIIDALALQGVNLIRERFSP